MEKKYKIIDLIPDEKALITNPPLCPGGDIPLDQIKYGYEDDEDEE